MDYIQIAKASDSDARLIEIYPELALTGSLAAALQAALVEAGSSLIVSQETMPIPFAYAHVSRDDRSSQLFVAAERRLFMADYWNRGVCFAKGNTPSLFDMAVSIVDWISRDSSGSEFVAQFNFTWLADDALAYEQGEEVEARWQYYLASSRYLELAPFIQAAALHPVLRKLFPFTSLYNFGLSRCTVHALRRDENVIPFVRPVDKGEFEVVWSGKQIIGRGNAEETVAMVVENLPPGCEGALPWIAMSAK